MIMMVAPPIVSLLNRIGLHSAGHWLPLQVHLRAIVMMNHYDHDDNHDDDDNDDEYDSNGKPGYYSGTAFWIDH